MAEPSRALALIPPAFTFEAHPVRVVMRDGEPWFVAADVCRALHLETTASVGLMPMKRVCIQRRPFPVTQKDAAVVINPWSSFRDQA